MRKILITFALLAALVASGCGSTGTGGTDTPTVPEAAFPVTISGPGGNITIEERPERIISLSPTATEMLFAIDAGDQVVAVDEMSNYPPEAPRSELSGFQPNVEAIGSKNPDLVVISNDPGELASSLDKLGINVMLQPAATKLQETYDQIAQLGKATGNSQQAEELVDSMKDDIARILKRAPKPASSATYYYELDTTYFTVTSKTFIGEIFSLLGLNNIADEADAQGTGYPQLSGEFIIKANPAIIFLADTKCCGQSGATVASRPGWEQIDAVKQDRVVELDDDIASRWGPRVVVLLEKAASALEDLAKVA